MAWVDDGLTEEAVRDASPQLFLELKVVRRREALHDGRCYLELADPAKLIHDARDEIPDDGVVDRDTLRPS